MMYKPGPRRLYFSEQLTDMQGVVRDLSISKEGAPHVCSVCNALCDALECHKCKRFICEACSRWKFSRRARPSIINVSCSCGALLYHDFC